MHARPYQPHAGKGREGGACTAAAFLQVWIVQHTCRIFPPHFMYYFLIQCCWQEFIDEGVDWAHLDIA